MTARDIHHMEDLGEGHLTALERAAYLDRGLPADVMRRVEAHLAECERCRWQLTEESRLVRQTRRKRQPVIVLTLLATAAVLVLIVSRRPAHTDAAPLRGQAPDSAAAPLVAYGPIGGQRANVRRFVWAPARGALSYRLTITSSDGTVLWSTSVADTSATLPDTVSLSGVPRYVWAVDAILRDGRTRSTGLHEVTTSP